MLGALGCHAVMLTGDAAAAAAAVGAATGIPPQRVHARLLPEEKLAKVLQQGRQYCWAAAVVLLGLVIPLPACLLCLPAAPPWVVQCTFPSHST